MNVRVKQAGSVANFIIIGVVLVVLTAGVIYAVRQQDTPSPQPTPVATEPEKTTDSPKKDDKPATDKPAAAPAPVAETPPVAAPAPTVATISQTGPVDTAVQLIALGAIAVVSVSFVRSRKLRSSL